MKKILVITLIAIGSVCLSGCSKEIPFEKFLLSEPSEQDVSVNYIKNINLTEEKIINIKSVSSSIFDKLGNKEFYLKEYGNRNNYLGEVSSYFEETYLKEIMSVSKKSDFEKIMDNIYLEENTGYKESKLIKVGINNEDNIYAVVEVISFSDFKEFTVSTIKLEFNADFKIIGSEIISLDDLAQNTTNEITKDSLLTNLSKNEKQALDRLLKPLNNSDLYNKIITDKSGQSKLISLIEGIELKNKDVNLLKELFMKGKGSFKNLFITNFEINDISSMALSEIEITVVNGEKIDKFLIIYSRIEECITDIRNL